MEYRKAIAEIKKGKILPIYVCYGKESYVMKQFLRTLTNTVVDKDLQDFAVSRFDLNEISLETVLEDAETLPFMAERKLIIAQRASFFTGAKENTKVEHNLEKLMDYMKAPMEHTVLVFTVDAEKLDERKKITKELKGQDALIPFSSLTTGELHQWIEQQTESSDCYFTSEAIDYLIVCTGANLQQLTQEIEKITLYATHGEITKETIDKLVTKSVEQSIFILIDEIVRMRVGKGLHILHELLKQREEPIKILMLMVRQFRIILQVKQLLQMGYSQQQIASQIGLHPYAVKIASEQGRNYNEKTLSHVLSRCADLDYAMKTGKMDKVLGLEMFLFQLAEGA
jgi:DNA polymerase-3 subunit delta